MTQPSPMPVDNPALVSLFTAQRFAPYLAASGRGQPEAARLYVWNIAASSAMWGDFAVLEVCLRNAMHHGLSRYAAREDWWQSVGLHPEDRAKVNDAIRSATVKKGAPPTSDDVVSELMLGFWVGLLANKYHQRLWVPALSGAFPHLLTTRRELHRKLERLRRLRNRLAHHEKVFNRNLGDDHKLAFAVLSAIHPAAESLVKQASRLPAVLVIRQDAVAGSTPPSF